MSLDIRECYNIFDLPFDAPLAEVSETYKKLVHVWHPDRFGKTPDLQQAAHAKLKRINRAYDELKAYLASGGKRPGGYSNRSASNEAACYRNSCKYLGGDDRLKRVSIIEISGRNALAEVSKDGVALLTRGSSGPEQAAYYPAPSIVSDLPPVDSRKSL